MQENKSPRRHGPGPKMAPAEKAKNFKSAILRLFRELKSFRILVTLALVLALFGSVLSIFTPNILSDLTDEISSGLVVNKDNLQKLSSEMQKNATAMNEIMPNILQFNITNETILNVNKSTDISDEDKLLFKEFLNKLNNEEVMNEIKTLPTSVLNVILSDTTYNDVLIKKEDKITFIKQDSNNMIIPDSIASVIFKEFKIDNTTISTSDQANIMVKFSDINESTTIDEIYKKIDEMPDSVKLVVKPHMDIEKIKQIALFLLILNLLSAIFNYIESISMTDVSNKFARKLRDSISKKINRLPLKYFDNNLSGDILSRVTNDVDTIAQSMNQSLATLVSATTLFVGTLIMMFITNWIMAITAILSSLIGFVFMFIVLGKSQKYFVARQNELGNLNGHIEEIYSGLNVVKVYNGVSESNAKFRELNKKMYDANRKSQFLSGLMMPMMNFIGNFGYVAVCIVGALLAMNGNISFGVIVAFISYVRLFTSPLAQIAQAMTSLQSTAAASERVFEFIDEEEMTSQESITNELDKSKVEGNIEFKNVMFTYDGNDKPTINDFSAVAKKGQKIAIVGPTGAGKTTMVNLLMKFYEITKGDILIDGVSTKNLTRENIHDLFTMVLQDTWLFDGTVKENIVYNRENISDERVREVCKVVGLDHFIKTLPNGYDSHISESESVSAGQRQLLTIARGMIEDSPFLILDEATSNVDTRTEELVQKAMDKLTEGRTSFIIAHRLSTIKNADLILVMKDGNIIEQGNHDELMKKRGFYADLYNSQFEL